MKRLVFLVMAAVNLGYLILGAVIFHFIEGTNESDAKRSFTIDHEKFVASHHCLTHAEVHAYVMRVLETHGEGVQVASITEKNNTGKVTSIDEELEDTNTNWDIPSCVLFCLTVMSTIGYGNLSPKTWSGQLFCMFYALTSIPMFATMLVGVGERLSLVISRIRKMRPWIKSNEVWDSRLKSIIICATGFMMICFIPSLAFSLTQDWTYLESLYYSVITLTTIGFGDLVPEPGKTKRHNVYRIVLSLWILLGLSWVALILSELSTFFQSKITTAASETQQRLSNLEDMVKKRAIETKNKIIKKEKDKDQDNGSGDDEGISSQDNIVSEENEEPEVKRKNKTNQIEHVGSGDMSEISLDAKGNGKENNV